MNILLGIKQQTSSLPFLNFYIHIKFAISVLWSFFFFFIPNSTLCSLIFPSSYQGLHCRSLFSYFSYRILHCCSFIFPFLYQILHWCSTSLLFRTKFSISALWVFIFHIKFYTGTQWAFIFAPNSPLLLFHFYSKFSIAVFGYLFSCKVQLWDFISHQYLQHCCFLNFHFSYFPVTKITNQKGRIKQKLAEKKTWYY